MFEENQILSDFEGWQCNFATSLREKSLHILNWFSFETHFQDLHPLISQSQCGFSAMYFNESGQYGWKDAKIFEN